MRILLVVSAFNSLSQRVFCHLRDRGEQVGIAFAITEEQLITETEAFFPDIIIAPFLKKRIPESIWSTIPTFIVHPGIAGDRGAHALDWAILNQSSEWGVCILRANGEYDAGDIYAHGTFAMPQRSKASLYRNETTSLSIRLADELLRVVNDSTFIPIAQDTESLSGSAHRAMTQSDRRIDWENDSTESILTKIRSADSHPGVLDTILGLECTLYGAHREGKLRGGIKEILAKREGAICLGTKDGAIWITHLKERHLPSIKLPATYVLKDRLKGVMEDRLPLFVHPTVETFKEITYIERDEIGYLGFDFHNGAMGAHQCVRLKYAFDHLKQSGIKVLVLMGGEEFFSNGIHLNIMEDSKKSEEDGWSNIHSMNEVVKSILLCDEVLTVSALRRNAGAGGVFLALAADLVVAREGVVLNPHYQTLGLHGSEYWTYTLPRRVGEEKAYALTSRCLPISAAYAQAIGLVDTVLSEDDETYREELHRYCFSLCEDDERYDELLDAKRQKINHTAFAEEIQRHREAELEQMYPSFYDPLSEFNRLRKDFVYKLCPIQTPNYLKGL
ncbi:MAG: hydrogenase maturation protein [Sulfuricurvum sp.]|uniref:hydrogenase maturation protein n=1 Tax=Sulfuricurvum sp. TaxID=2025608 RepID=UPI002732656B|nr:hydrogenase maturation protein [Sulfuricurvum sp.]MDP3291655.1 hydrogenase maturation protein [Sulfuricurvum sp.]